MNDGYETRLPMPVQAAAAAVDAGKWKVLCESVFPSAKSPQSIVMALDYCRARGLDVFKRPVNIVPMWNSALGKEVETVWPSINEVQVTAARTGQYAGMDAPSWGPDKTRTFKGTVNKKNENKVWEKRELVVELTYPEWCSVTVYRMVGGQRCPFTEPVFWEEAYARLGKTDVPNDMWAKRPRGQLLKVAKAFALRAAFPEEGEYVAEEMHGLETKSGGVIIDNEPQPPANPSPFKNAAERNRFCRNALKAISDADTLAKLQDLGEIYKPQLEAMAASDDEKDRLGYGEIKKQYGDALKLAKEAVAAEAASIIEGSAKEQSAKFRRKTVDDSFDPPPSVDDLDGDVPSWMLENAPDDDEANVDRGARS